MKKSFMTRALAMGLSLAMAFSLSAATNVSVASAATTPAMASKQFAVRVGGATKSYKASTATQKSFKITKATVGNTDKATVKVNSSKKSIKVTPGTVTGTTVVTLSFKNIKTSKITAKKYRCVVKAAVEEKPETPVEEALALSEVKQIASNTVTVSFTKDASKDVTKDNLTIKSADGSVQFNVKSVTFSADGKTAEVVVYGNFVDGTTYNVTYAETEKSFAASVGAVANVVIYTTTAQQNVSTPIDFALFDGNGIDVTSSILLDSYTHISISGTYATAEISKPSEAKLTLANVNDVVKVTVTYNANTKDSVDVSATQDITCVEAVQAKGTALFKAKPTTNEINDKSGCAKFYQGLSDKAAMVAVGDTAFSGGTKIYFCATDDNGDVIQYDSYAVESSNNNIVAAAIQSTDPSTGKYTVITANGNNIGSAQLNVTASKNGKTTTYVIPVTTYKPGLATSMTVEISRPVMSNADDAAYSSTITAQLYDAAKQKVDGTYTCELTTKNITTPAAVDGGEISTSTTGKFEITAKDAVARTYSFTVKGSDNVNGSTAQERSINILVKALPAELTKVTYQLEVSNSTPDIASYGTTGVKLYATYDGLFAGYVRTNDTAHVGGRDIPAAQQIKSITGSAIFGTLTFGEASGTLNNVNTLVATGDPIDVTGGGIAATTFSTVVTGSTVVSNWVGSTNYDPVDTRIGKSDADVAQDGGIARTGEYKIKYELTMNDGKDTVVPLTAGINVKNSYVQPTVKVLSTKVNKLTFNDIKADGFLSTNVDMNNNISSSESITGFVEADYTTAINAPNAGTNNDKMVVKYAVVKDNINGDLWTFYVPVNQTFTQK